jgi:hypothetical protein
MYTLYAGREHMAKTIELRTELEKKLEQALGHSGAKDIKVWLLQGQAHRRDDSAHMHDDVAYRHGHEGGKVEPDSVPMERGGGRNTDGRGESEKAEG